MKAKKNVKLKNKYGDELIKNNKKTKGDTFVTFQKLFDRFI